MKLRHLYLALALIGLVLPYSQFVPWLFAHGLDASLFLRQMFANRVASFFACDVLVSAAALFVFVGREGPKVKVRHAWLAIAGTLLVGVSFGLPLFLYLRQVQLDHAQS